MENGTTREYVGHCLVLALPAQGHISPALQFSKRLVQKRVRVTLVSTIYFFNNLPQNDITSDSNITLETISCGFDEGGYEEAGSLEAYWDSLRHVGSRTLSELVRRLASSGAPPVDCIVYDSHLPWALDVAKGLGLMGASFMTQPCAVDSVYFHAYNKWMKLPLEEDEGKDGISLPALPLLAPSDLPSFLCGYDESDSFKRELGLNQFSNIDKADWVLVNSFYELEHESPLDEPSASAPLRGALARIRPKHPPRLRHRTLTAPLHLGDHLSTSRVSFTPLGSYADVDQRQTTSPGKVTDLAIVFIPREPPPAVGCLQVVFRELELDEGSRIHQNS